MRPSDNRWGGESSEAVKERVRKAEDLVKDMVLDGNEQRRINRAKAWLFIVVVIIAGILAAIGTLIASQVWPAHPVQVYSAKIAPDGGEACLYDREVSVLLDYKISDRYDIEAITFTQEWSALGQASQTFPGGDLTLESSKHEMPPPVRSNAVAPYQPIAPTTPDSYHLSTTVTVTYKVFGIPRTDTFDYATSGIVTVEPKLHC